MSDTRVGWNVEQSERNARMAAARKNGVKLAEIAAKEGLSLARVKQILKRYGLNSLREYRKNAGS